MSSSVTPPIPRQPIGRTFLVSISLLGLFAFVQLVAIAWHVLPPLRNQIFAQKAEAEPSEAPATPKESPTSAAAMDTAKIAQAAQMVSEADRNFRVGDFSAALRSLQDAEALIPNDPSILFRLAQTFEALDDKAQAFVYFERSVNVPGLPSQIRRQAEQKMALIAQVIGSSPGQSASSSTPANSTVPDSYGQAVRDEIGLQPGASLGIVDTRLKDSQAGAKTLRIAVKSRPGTKIDVSAMNVHVFFYEQDESGEVLLTAAKPATQWISPPIDWADSEPELLNVEYPMPDGGLPGNSSEMGAPGRMYYGYVVGVYYKGELQDSRADPGRLDTLFPLKLSIK